MEEINMLDSIERYIRGEMLPAERAAPVWIKWL
jgi:hypothetical protein